MNKTRVKLITVFFFGSLVMLLNVSTGHAAPCTPGTDCYCDHVKKVGDPLYDPNLVMCEDYEAPTLRLNQGVGNGAPYFGPWYDNTGDNGALDRGHNSYWLQHYGTPIGGANWSAGQPATPTFGVTCGPSNTQGCTGLKVWDPTNRWGGNAYNPIAAVMTQASDFTAEIPTLTVPTNTSSGTPGVFHGNASWAQHHPAGVSSGIIGFKAFPQGVLRTFGYTVAMAYSSNTDAAGAWGGAGGNGAPRASWKHHEWTTVHLPNGGFDGLFQFYNQNGPDDGRPFAGFFGSFVDATCTNVGKILTLGNVSCDFGNTGMSWNTPANYHQPTDWPWGTWGCVRGYMQNAGTSASRMQVWFQGPNMTSERLIIDVTVDGTKLDMRDGYNGVNLNTYQNTNAGAQYGYVATTQLNFRYEDNMHVTAGMPVSCAQIGFVGAGGGGPAPSAPTGLKIF
jgi:hypothetical protein